MKCSNPNCNETDHEIGAKFCHVCGQPLPNDSIREEEGSQKAADNRTGTPARASGFETPKPTSDSVVDNTRPKKNKVWILFVILGAVLFIALVVLLSDIISSNEYGGIENVFMPQYEEQPSAGGEYNYDNNSTGVTVTIDDPTVATDPTYGSDNNSGVVIYDGQGEVIYDGQTYVADDNSVIVVNGGTVITNNNNTVTQASNLDSNYSELSIDNTFDVWVSSEAAQVTVTADESIMPNVKVERNGYKLKMYLKGSNNNMGQRVKVVLPYNLGNLTKVNLSGASTFHSDQALDGVKVEVNLSGSSDFHCDINATEAYVNISGSSSMSSSVEANIFNIDMAGASQAHLGGQADLLKISLGGSCSLAGNGGVISCDRCVGSMSGSSSARIYCDENISVNLRGTSSLHYSGWASTTGSSTSLTSDIIQE